MCFPSQAANANANPAPYALNQSAAQVTETATPASGNPISAAAAADDAKDKPTPAVTGYSVASGLSTATL